MQLNQRQETVLRALVRAHVGGAGPVGSTTLAHTLPIQLSAASIRTTMAELTELGLIEQPHTSAGRVPTEAGLRLFVDELVAAPGVGEWERRQIAHELESAGADVSLQVASGLLSARTHQLGFAVLPRLDRVALRHASLIRVCSDRVLVVLVSRSGVTYQRVIRDDRSGDQARLERIEAELNRRLAGHSLVELRVLLERESARLRDRAERLVFDTLLAAVHALAREAVSQADVLIPTRRPLVEQPEFHDPGRLAELWAVLETHQALLALLDRVLDRGGVAVTFGGEVNVPALRQCAAVTAACGTDDARALVGVLGPSRMDYARVIPLVHLFSELVTEKWVR
jgi:heat-inducible transcriptional repressor